MLPTKWTSEGCKKRLQECKTLEDYTYLWCGLTRRLGRAMRQSMETGDESLYLLAEYNWNLFDKVDDEINPHEWIDHPERYTNEDEI